VPSGKTACPYFTGNRSFLLSIQLLIAKGTTMTDRRKVLALGAASFLLPTTVVLAEENCAAPPHSGRCLIRGPTFFQSLFLGLLPRSISPQHSGRGKPAVFD
jgi:hypothetical protein